MTDHLPSLDPAELERRLSDHYRAMPHDADPMLTSRVVAALDRAPGPRRSPSLWRVALAGAAAVVLVAVLVGPRLMPAVGPGSTTGPGLPAGPTFNTPAALNAQVDTVGVMRSGGIWAAQGDYLLTSTDNGTTWKAGRLPTPYLAIDVLDPTHAWTIGAVQDPSGLVAPSIPASGMVVNRTADGGRTWQRAAMSGQSCRVADLAFVDPNRGFLICLGATTTGAPVPASGPDAIFRTDDGGATWSVAGRTSGLGLKFAVSDTDTLWSAPDFATSETAGVSLRVSRDAGVTWVSVALPEIGSLSPPDSGIVVAHGPSFWDASNGTLAVEVYRYGQNWGPPAFWFYRTADGGHSWTLTKIPSQMPTVSGFGVDVVAGRQWVIAGQGIGQSGAAGPLSMEDLSVSSDFGASWANVAGSGMPPDTIWDWLEFTDKDHGVGMVFAGVPGVEVLLQTSDGGRTWIAADFGNSRALVTADPAQDAARADTIAGNYHSLGRHSASAWDMLSPYSQRQFGSEAEFLSTWAALARRTNYSAQIGTATQSADRLNRTALGGGVWDDVNVFADMSRAYVVVVTFPGSTEPTQKLVVAPLSATGEWRIWVATSG